MQRWIRRREKSTPWKGVALTLTTEAYNRADGRGFNQRPQCRRSQRHVRRKKGPVSRKGYGADVRGGRAQHTQALGAPKVPQAEGGRTAGLCSRQNAANGAVNTRKKEHNTEATSVTNPSSSHSTKHRQWLSRLSKDAACRAHLSAIATTSAVWPEKCRWGRAVVGVGPADAVLGSTMTAPTSTREELHGGGD
jgi:hypothetical protein